jgi:hypothetical protein
MLAGAARGEKDSKGGEGRVRLPDVNTGRLSELKYTLDSLRLQLMKSTVLVESSI